MASTRERALSHQQYLDALHPPSPAEWHRIAEIQQRKEIQIDAKYNTSEEHDAASIIQKAYRGHRARRQLQGLTLDPSSRWLELIKELRFRAATVPHYGIASPGVSAIRRPRVPSDVAKLNWLRVGQIAEHAGGVAARPKTLQSGDYIEAQEPQADDGGGSSTSDFMLMDPRYFLEMVDHRHRYGANLQVYHQEWLRSTIDQSFFYWLDYGEGRHLDLPGCTRAKLDKESIRYLSRDERLAYLVTVDEDGKLRWHKNNELITTSSEQFKDSMLGVVPKSETDALEFTDEELTRQRSDDQRAFRHLLRTRSDGSIASIDELSLSDTRDSNLHATSHDNYKTSRLRKQSRRHAVSPATILNHLLRATVKPGTWIYVADTVGRLYVGIKSSGTFQHASFLSGARISSAGSIAIESGQLTYLAPLSGHYRPTTKSFVTFIQGLKDQDVDLSQTRVSHAFEILQGMEVIGKSKKGLKRVFKGRRSRDNSTSQSDTVNTLPATNFVEHNWEMEHEKKVSHSMSGLKIYRRSIDCDITNRG